MSRLASVETRLYILEKALEALEARVEGLVQQPEPSSKLEKKAPKKKPQEVGEDE